MPEKILIVEDEPTLVETLEYNLKQQGYEIVIAIDGYEALDKARQEKPDLILLDVMLPGLDGFEVCRVLRQEMNTPILMLTARTDEIDEIVGLEIGADDYMTKPFSMRGLLARVKAQLRRIRLLRSEATSGLPQNSLSNEANTEVFTFDDLIVDLRSREVTSAGRLLHLKPMEFELLSFLVHNQGRVLSRELILKRVWGWEHVGGSRTVDVHVRWLREKIEKSPGTPKRIVTVRSIGYRFEG